MSRMCTRSSLRLLVTQMVERHSCTSSRIFFMGGGGKVGGRSGKRRTSSLRNSLVLIWRWNAYPQFLTRMSSSCVRMVGVSVFYSRSAERAAHVEGEHGDMRVAVVDEAHHLDGRLPRPAP